MAFSANDLDTVGLWDVQGYIEMSGGKWHTTVHGFSVKENLS